MLSILLNKLFLFNGHPNEDDALLEEIAQASNLTQLEAIFPRIPKIKALQEAYTARKMALEQEYERQVIQDIKQVDTVAQLEELYSRVLTNPRLMEMYIKCMNELRQEKRFLKEIKKATCVRELQDIQDKMPQNSKIVSAYNSRSQEIRMNSREEYLKLQQRITTFINHNGEMVSEEDLISGIRRQIPANTYVLINVSTIANYQFTHDCTRARKIELIRKECGFGRVVEAGFSACFVTDSVYRQVISDNTLMKGILASSDITENEAAKRDFTQQVIAAYWKGYKIEIMLPFDLTENGVVSVTSSFESLSFSINAGRWVRSLFTNN